MTVDNLIKVLRRMPGNYNIAVGVLQPYDFSTPELTRSTRRITATLNDADKEVCLYGRQGMKASEKII